AQADEARVTAFEDTVRTTAEELLTWPGDSAAPHIHFDDKRFEGLVPDFADPSWVRLAVVAAEAANGTFLIHVPLGEWKVPPDGTKVGRQKNLRPWEPPAIYLLNHGSAFAVRDREGAWHDDAVAPAERATGWLGGHLAEDSGLWRVALMYETAPSGVGLHS
ncbi:MAG: hypothetical protein ACRDPA_11020, partial [Solirubrobacteraceae bacterium]